jgi:hypothetical protein
MLTVEEAARVLRIGRTKAYALAREYRDTGGRCGLPVVDFGDVLRIPRCRLEQLIGGELPVTLPAVDGQATAEPTRGARQPAPRARTRRSNRLARNTTTTQLTLIDLTSSD